MKNEKTGLLADVLDEFIKKAKAQPKQRIFFVDNFLSLGAEKDIIEVFSKLENFGFVIVMANVFCEKCHLSWSGPLGLSDNDIFCETCVPKRKILDPRKKVYVEMTEVFKKECVK